jgi:hypothetical protein
MFILHDSSQFIVLLKAAHPSPNLIGYQAGITPVFILPSFPALRF